MKLGRVYQVDDNGQEIKGSGYEEYSRSNPKYVVAIRSWYDGHNSYFTGRIFGGDELLYIPFQYGHGEGNYRIEALKVLGIDHTVTDWEITSALIGIDCANVARRKDLHKQGR